MEQWRLSGVETTKGNIPCHGLYLDSSMSGGRCENNVVFRNAGSWKLITERLHADKPRRFDSYESFPFYAVGPQEFPGDGVNARIMRNGKQIWPDSGWAFSADATVKVPFDVSTDAAAGDKVLWFSKLGDDCGKAAVSIDGGTPEVVDTYSADDIWGVCVFQKELPTAGRHTFRIEVLGAKGPMTKGTVVYIDGIQIRPE